MSCALEENCDTGGATVTVIVKELNGIVNHPNDCPFLYTTG